MDMTEITQLINAMGFPIVAFIMMYWMCNTTIKENTSSTIELKDAINRLNERLGENINA